MRWVVKIVHGCPTDRVYHLGEGFEPSLRCAVAIHTWLGSCSCSCSYRVACLRRKELLLWLHCLHQRPVLLHFVFAAIRREKETTPGRFHLSSYGPLSAIPRPKSNHFPVTFKHTVGEALWGKRSWSCICVKEMGTKQKDAQICAVAICDKPSHPRALLSTGPHAITVASHQIATD